MAFITSQESRVRGSKPSSLERDSIGTGWREPSTQMFKIGPKHVLITGDWKSPSPPEINILRGQRGGQSVVISQTISWVSQKRLLSEVGISLFVEFFHAI